MANQIELHPYCRQDELLKFLKDQHILPVAYCPLGRPIPQDGDATGSQGSENLPDLRDNDKIVAIAEKHGKPVFQVTLKWGLQRGCGVIPKSSSVEHQKANLSGLSDFTLSEEEMNVISSLEPQGLRICNKFKSFNEYDVFA